MHLQSLNDYFKSKRMKDVALVNRKAVGELAKNKTGDNYLQVNGIQDLKIAIEW